MAACKCGNHADLAQEEAFNKLFDLFRDQKGALIPVLQEAQNIFGYLPKEVMERIGRELKIPVSKVYGVATFYAQFHLKPRGRNIIRVCQGTACHVRGGAKIFQAIQNKLGVADGETTPDQRYTLETVACLGACGLAPVMMVNEDTHGRLTPEKAIKTLDQYK